MRDYLYLWNDPKNRRVVASGIQFADVVQGLAERLGGVVLLKHEYEDGIHDPATRLDYVGNEGVVGVCDQDTCSWGDLRWADFTGTPSAKNPFPSLAKEGLAELLYFAHTAEPLRDVSIPGLGNRYLAAAHDNGWFLMLYYADWNVVTTCCHPSRFRAIYWDNRCSLKGESMPFGSTTTACLRRREPRTSTES